MENTLYYGDNLDILRRCIPVVLGGMNWVLNRVIEKPKK